MSNGLAQSLPFYVALGVTLCLTATLAVISAIDLKTLRIPDALSFLLIGSGLALAFTVPEVSAVDHLIGAIAAFALFAGLGEGYFRLRGVDGLGLGDAKLFAAAGAWLGWQNLPVVLLIATLGGLLQAVVLRTGRAAPLAFGPWIAAGFWSVWVWTGWRDLIG